MQRGADEPGRDLERRDHGGAEFARLVAIVETDRARVLASTRIGTITELLARSAAMLTPLRALRFVRPHEDGAAGRQLRTEAVGLALVPMPSREEPHSEGATPSASHSLLMTSQRSPCGPTSASASVVRSTSAASPSRRSASRHHPHGFRRFEQQAAHLGRRGQQCFAAPQGYVDGRQPGVGNK